MDFTLSTYYPIFLFLLVILGFAVSALLATHLVGPKQRTPVKQMPYESGMDPIGDARQRFDVKFYLIAILFLVFDVELLFLYPWAALYPWSSTPASQARFCPSSSEPGLLGSAGVPADGGGRLRLRLAERGVPMAVDGLSGERHGDAAGQAGQLGAQEQSVADAVRHGLLRHRVDGHRRVAARHRPLRRRGHALHAAAVRSDDRRRPGGHEDAAGAAAHLAANAGAEMVHFDGRLRLRRAASSTPTPWCRASIASFRWTCTFPAVRRGRSSCCNR